MADLARFCSALLMLVEISSTKTNKQEIDYTLLVSLQYKERDYLRKKVLLKIKNIYRKEIFQIGNFFKKGQKFLKRCRIFRNQSLL
jgi:hypothetical protein